LKLMWISSPLSPCELIMQKLNLKSPYPFISISIETCILWSKAGPEMWSDGWQWQSWHSWLPEQKQSGQHIRQKW
jgi:hypothetical protein